MVDLADQFKDTRNMSAVQAVDKGKSYSQRKPEHSKRTEKPDVKETSKTERKCYWCNRFGHIAPECKIKPVVGNVSDGKCSSEQIKGKPVCFVSTIPSNSIIDSRVSNAPTTQHVRELLTSSCLYLRATKMELQLQS